MSFSPPSLLDNTAHMDSILTLIGTSLSQIGQLPAVAGLPMLLGYLIPIPSVARFLRRAAVVTALALPLGMLLLLAFIAFTGATNVGVFFDFRVNYDAAISLYRDGGSPYAVIGAYSFPFPSFYCYWLLSGFGALNIVNAWFVWWVLNLMVWIACTVVLWRSVNVRLTDVPPLQRDLIRFAVVMIPALTTIWQGQTALYILAGLTALHVALQPGARRLTVLAGSAGLAVAALIKPQIGLIGAGLLLAALLKWRSDRPASLRIAAILLISALIGTVLVVLTLLLPGGVTLDTYREFMDYGLGRAGNPAEALVIGSPAYATGAFVYAQTGSVSLSLTVSTLVTLVVVALAAVWTYRHRADTSAVIAAGWGVWAIVAPRIAWGWYATWCLLFFLLALKRPLTKWRQIAFVVLLTLLPLQSTLWPLELGVIGLLMALLWISPLRP